MFEDIKEGAKVVIRSRGFKDHGRPYIYEVTKVTPKRFIVKRKSTQYQVDKTSGSILGEDFCVEEITERVRAELQEIKRARVREQFIKSIQERVHEAPIETLEKIWTILCG